MLPSAIANILPPRPPSPPSGPPRGTNFSRRNDALPSPPLPAWTSMLASSMNFMSVCQRKKSPVVRQGLFARKMVRSGRKDAHHFVLERPFVREQDFSVDLGEQRMVTAH